MRLYTYLSGNRDGLISYRKRGLKLPPLPDGMIYGNMGVQENHNYSVITARMKNNRTSWSLRGATNMAKVLTSRENGWLDEIIRRCEDRELLNSNIYRGKIPVEEILPGKIGESVGSPDMVATIHPPICDWERSPEINALIEKILG